VSLGFRCPKCGSQYFTTVGSTDVSPSKRQCKGRLTGRQYAGCDYNWTSDYDNRHGLDNIRDPQKGPEEMTEPIRCKDCVWWGKVNEYGPPIVGSHVGAKKHCGRLQYGPHHEQHLVVLEDGDYASSNASLWTEPEFFCALAEVAVDV
jgi:hypothetical protein